LPTSANRLRRGISVALLGVSISLSCWWGAAPVGAQPDSCNALVEAGYAQLSSPGFRARMTQERSEGDETRIVEFVPPNRFHIVNPNGQDFIVVGSVAFIHVPNLGYRQVPGGIGDIAGEMAGTLTEAQRQAASCQLIGDDMVDGIPTRAYGFTMAYTDTSAGQPVAINTSGVTWVRTDDGRPIRSLIDGQVGGFRAVTRLTIEYPPDLEIDPDAPRATP